MKRISASTDDRFIHSLEESRVNFFFVSFFFFFLNRKNVTGDDQTDSSGPPGPSVDRSGANREKVNFNSIKSPLKLSFKNLKKSLFKIIFLKKFPTNSNNIIIFGINFKIIKLKLN